MMFCIFFVFAEFVLVLVDQVVAAIVLLSLPLSQPYHTELLLLGQQQAQVQTLQCILACYTTIVFKIVILYITLRNMTCLEDRANRKKLMQELAPTCWSSQCTVKPPSGMWLSPTMQL